MNKKLQIVLISIIALTLILCYLTGVSLIAIQENIALNNIETQKEIIWVDFDVIGTIRVNVADTNEGEVPDEAWEKGERFLGRFAAYPSMKMKVKDYGVYKNYSKYD